MSEIFIVHNDETTRSVIVYYHIKNKSLFQPIYQINMETFTSLSPISDLWNKIRNVFSCSSNKKTNKNKTKQNKTFSLLTVCFCRHKWHVSTVFMPSNINKTEICLSVTFCVGCCSSNFEYSKRKNCLFWVSVCLCCDVTLFEHFLQF